MPFSKSIWLIPYDVICLLLSGIIRLYFIALRYTCRINIKGHILPEAHIHAFWHQNLPLYFVCHSKRSVLPKIWMQHPKWYMKSIHFLLWWSGIKIAYGSSGNNGQKALNQIVEHLNNGYSTAINPDGPKGPPQQLKNGIIQMSQKSGRPIQVVKFKSSCHIKLKSWDKKILPFPFSKIDIFYSEAFYPNKESFESQKTNVTKALLML